MSGFAGVAVKDRDISVLRCLGMMSFFTNTRARARNRPKMLVIARKQQGSRGTGVYLRTGKKQAKAAGVVRRDIKKDG